MWFFNTRFSEPVSWTKKYLIRTVTLRNSGYYFCYGSYEHEVRDYFSKGEEFFSQKGEHFLATTELRVYGEL